MNVDICGQTHNGYSTLTLVQDHRNPEYIFNLNVCLHLWKSHYHPIGYVDYLLSKALCCHPSATVSAQLPHETDNNGQIIPGQGRDS